MRIYDAICELIEAHAARVRTETIENEFANADWAMADVDGDDDD